jgi:hypothetical protein
LSSLNAYLKYNKAEDRENKKAKLFGLKAVQFITSTFIGCTAKIKEEKKAKSL